MCLSPLLDHVCLDRNVIIAQQDLRCIVLLDSLQPTILVLDFRST